MPYQSAIGVEFRTVVVTSIIVLVATGAILAFDRLTEVEPPYAATLGIKVVLSLWMFAPRPRPQTSRENP